MAPASHSAAGPCARSPMEPRAGCPCPPVLSLGSVRQSCSPAASSALEAHPIKELSGHGGLFLAGTRQPPPGPAACPHPAAKISLLHPPPQAPGGAETKPAARQGPEPGTLGMGPQPPGPPARPRGSWKGGGDGAETGGTGTGRVRWWHNVFLPAVAAARRGRLRGRRCLSGARPRGRTVAAGAQHHPAGTGRDGESKSMRGQQRSQRFTHSGRYQSPLRPPADSFLGAV